MNFSRLAWKLMCLLIMPAIIFSAYGCASMQPLKTSDLTFDRIIQVPGYSKDQIYDFTKIWIAENFRSAKAVLEYENKETGCIIGNGSIKYPCSGMECLAKKDWTVHFTMRVDMKDQKLRTTFSNLLLAWPASYNSTFGFQKAYEGPIKTKGDLAAIKPALLSLGSQIATSMNSPRVSSDW